MGKQVTESEFYMWRTLFAIAHVDDIVSKEEVRFMAEVLEDNSFNDEQRAILNDDIKNSRDISEMFSKISDKKDQARFFSLARKLVHIDGDFGDAEQLAMLKILSEHIRSVDLDQLIGKMEFELEDEEEKLFDPVALFKQETHTFMHFFRQRFVKGLLGR